MVIKIGYNFITRGHNMKVTLRYGEYEATIEDEKEEDRQSLLNDARVCINEMIIANTPQADEDEPEDEDTLLQASIEPGQAKQINPDITFKTAYA